MSEDAAASGQRMQLSKDIGKVAERVAALEAGQAALIKSIGEFAEATRKVAEKADARMSIMEDHSAKVCSAAKTMQFVLRVVIPTIGALVAIAGGVAAMAGWLP